MSLTRKMEQPAIIMMLDDSLGDLFVVVSEDGHWVVRIDDTLEGSEETRRAFRRGYVSTSTANAPYLIRLANGKGSTPCRPILCTTACEECAGQMYPKDNIFVCKVCGATR